MNGGLWAIFSRLLQKFSLLIFIIYTYLCRPMHFEVLSPAGFSFKNIQLPFANKSFVNN